ncbi:amidohydrolase family protein [Bacillus safensis]
MGVWNFKGGSIWSEKGFIPNKSTRITVTHEDDRDIHLSESSVIVPGLVDFHCHLWAPGAEIGVKDKQYLSSGVTTVGDAGTFGYDGWEEANRYWEKSSLTVRSWLSALPEGLTNHPNPNPTKPESISLDRIVEVASLADDRLLGIKIRLGQVDITTDRSLLRLAREAADRTDLRMMVHLTETKLDIEEVTQYFNKGDILTHPFQGRDGNVLNTAGKVKKEFLDAVERGIVLDIGHGRKHFNWNVFYKCLAEGIKPDTISSDLTSASWRKYPVYNMSYIISKMIVGGLSLDEAFRTVLVTAPKLLGIDDFTFTPNNLVVLDSTSTETAFPDVDGETVLGNINYQPKHLIFNGIPDIESVSSWK